MDRTDHPESLPPPDRDTSERPARGRRGIARSRIEPIPPACARAPVCGMSRGDPTRPEDGVSSMQTTAGNGLEEPIVMELDGELRHVRASDAALAMVGLPAEALLGRTAARGRPARPRSSCRSRRASARRVGDRRGAPDRAGDAHRRGPALAAPAARARASRTATARRVAVARHRHHAPASTPSCASAPATPRSARWSRTRPTRSR